MSDRSISRKRFLVGSGITMAGVLVGRGLAYAQLRQFSHAMDDFSEALRINPRDSYAFADRGDFRGKTLRVNGGLTNYPTRLQWRASWAAVSF